MINGLSYIDSFVTELEQQDLIQTIDNQSWLLDLKRRTQHYGYKYDYKKKTIDSSSKLGPLPLWLEPYLEKLNGIFIQPIDQVIVNGRLFNNMALNIIHSLRPSKIRVSTGEVTCDSRT